MRQTHKYLEKTKESKEKNTLICIRGTFWRKLATPKTRSYCSCNFRWEKVFPAFWCNNSGHIMKQPNLFYDQCLTLSQFYSRRLTLNSFILIAFFRKMNSEVFACRFYAQMKPYLLDFELSFDIFLAFSVNMKWVVWKKSSPTWKFTVITKFLESLPKFRTFFRNEKKCLALWNFSTEVVQETVNKADGCEIGNWLAGMRGSGLTYFYVNWRCSMSIILFEGGLKVVNKQETAQIKTVGIQLLW